jgi:hypothetical protein
MLDKTPVKSSIFSRNRLFVAAGLAGAALSGFLAYSRAAAELAHPHAARMSANQAARQMLSLCSRNEGPCEMPAPPVFFDETRYSCPPFSLHRKLWQGIAQANGRLVHLTLNDATGKMASLYYFDEAPKTSLQPKIAAPVKTRLEAARLSLLLLRSWEMIPSHAEVALETTPVAVHSESEWWITWRVRETPDAIPYRVKVSLSSKDGNVLTAIDRRGMAQSQYARR